jgi:hypothetical protein
MKNKAVFALRGNRVLQVRLRWSFDTVNRHYKLSSGFSLFPLFTPLFPQGALRRFPSFALVLFLLPAIGIEALSEPLPADFDGDMLLKPLVDTTTNATSTPSASSRTGPAPAPFVLNGKVESLQAAIDIERNRVDWYGWYLSVREYLERTGGLPCRLGTPIRFYRNGRIEALTSEPGCRISVERRRFRLPPETVLEAVVLPVRRGTLPPASPAEVYSRIGE